MSDGINNLTRNTGMMLRDDAQRGKAMPDPTALLDARSRRGITEIAQRVANVWREPQCIYFGRDGSWSYHALARIGWSYVDVVYPQEESHA